MPNSLMFQAPQPQITPAQVNNAHGHFSDMQQDLMELLHLPDEELTQGKVLGMASDLVTKHNLSNGKRGATAMQVASELASSDFPTQDKANPQTLRKFLLNHFNRITNQQAALTQKFGPPSQPVE